LNLCKSSHLDGSARDLDPNGDELCRFRGAALRSESLPFRKNERMFEEKSILDAEPRRHCHGRSAQDETPVYRNGPWYGPRDYQDIYGNRPDLVRRHHGRRGS
jgi:hypothetical protein